MLKSLRKFIARWFARGPHALPVVPMEGYQEQAQLVSIDENLLERSRAQWQFGDWESLAMLKHEVIQHHPDRAKLALLVASALLQLGDVHKAQSFVHLAQSYGCSKKLTNQILISGVYNSLGRASAIAGLKNRSIQHFQKAVVYGAPHLDFIPITQARINQQLTQLGMPAKQFATELKVIHPEPVIESISPVVTSDSNIKLANKYQGISSAQYWDNRYRGGGNSGNGSYGRLAVFKADVLNKFINEHCIDMILDFGCGDGNQISLFNVKKYIGIDVSEFIIKRCRDQFSGDNAKQFFTNTEFLKSPISSPLTISLDVIYHLIENEVFESYMRLLFQSSTRFCIIYGCDESEHESDAKHVRRRKFTTWIENNLKHWKLNTIIFNKYPHDGSDNPLDSSFSNFYVFENTLQPNQP